MDPTEPSRLIAQAIHVERDIGWLERAEDGWYVVKAVKPVYQEGIVQLQFPTAATVDGAIEEAILGTAGYLWLLALRHDDFNDFAEREIATPSMDDDEIPF